MKKKNLSLKTLISYKFHSQDAASHSDYDSNHREEEAIVTKKNIGLCLYLYLQMKYNQSTLILTFFARAKLIA